MKNQEGLLNMTFEELSDFCEENQMTVDPKYFEKNEINALRADILNEIEIIFKDSETEIYSSTNREKEFENFDTKKCPFCAERIKTKAKICRFCNSKLNKFESSTFDISENELDSNKVLNIQADSPVIDGAKFGCGMFILLPLILLGIILFFVFVGGSFVLTLP